MTAPVGQSNLNAAAQTSRTAPAPAASPAEPKDQLVSSVASPDQLVTVTVPVNVPANFLQQDPKTGHAPIDNYEVKLVSPDMVITTRDDVKAYTDQIAKEAHPPGYKLVLNDSPAGMKVEVGRKVGMGVVNMAGFLGAQTAMWHSSFLAIPTPIAGPLALVGGTVGLFSSLEQTKAALDQKAYFEGLKANHEPNAPIGLPNGQKVLVPTDMAINMARNQAIAGAGQGVSNALVAGAGVALLAGASAIAAPIAIASIATGIGVQLYVQRAALLALAEKLWNAIKSPFTHHKDKAQEAETKPDSAPASGQPSGEQPAATPAAAPQIPTPEEAAARIKQLEPAIAQNLQKLQAIREQVASNPKLLEDPQVKQLFGETSQMTQEYTVCKAVVALQTTTPEQAAAHMKQLEPQIESTMTELKKLSPEDLQKPENGQKLAQLQQMQQDYQLSQAMLAVAEAQAQQQQAPAPTK
ncbi:MAG: hypothetical protein ACYCW6_28425 [Candidatus Xenobia bacterium]